MTQTFTVDLPNTLVLNANQRLHWAPKAERTRSIIAATQTLARKHRVRPQGKATIYIGVTKATKRSFDAQNLYPTFKAIVDALVRLGILDEDDNAHVIGPCGYQAGVNKTLAAHGHTPERTRFTITLTEYSPLNF